MIREAITFMFQFQVMEVSDRFEFPVKIWYWICNTFLVVVCFQTVESLAEKIIFLIFYHLILTLFVWSYFKTIFAPKCETPPKWKLSPAMVERLGKAHSEEEWKNLLELYVVEMEVSVMQRSIQGAIR